MGRRKAMVGGIETELYELWANPPKEEEEGKGKEEEEKGKEEEKKGNGKVALVFVPGNPGILGFYTDFFLDIFRRFPQKIDLLAIGHAGHNHDIGENCGDNNTFLPYPSSFPTRYSLQEQIEHKRAFLRGLEYEKIILMGHSIGAYMCLQMLNDDQLKEKIVRVLHVMPTIEKLYQGFAPAVRVMTNPWFHNIMGYIAHYLPRSLVRYIDGRNPNHARFSDLIVNSLNFGVATNVLYMAHTEGCELLEMTPELEKHISEHLEKLSFLYSPADPYTPSDMIEMMQNIFPSLDITLTDDTVPHAFVLKKESEGVVVDYVCEKIEKELEE